MTIQGIGLRFGEDGSPGMAKYVAQGLFLPARKVLYDSRKLFHFRGCRQ